MIKYHLKSIFREKFHNSFTEITFNYSFCLPFTIRTPTKYIYPHNSVFKPVQHLKVNLDYFPINTLVFKLSLSKLARLEASAVH